MHHVLKQAGLLIAAMVVALSSHAASDEAVAKEQLKKTVDRVLEVIADKAIVGDARRDEIRAEVLGRFAMPQMSGLVLGGNWKPLEKSKRDAFVTLFGDTLLDSYMRKIETYAGETVVYGKVVIKGKKGVAETILKGADKSIPVVYKMFKSGDDWKVYDVVIDGVSVIKTYRSQYREFLADQSVDELLKAMSDKLKK